MGGGRNPGSDFSDETAYKIDQQVKEIVGHCYKQAVQMISENRVAVDRIVDVLLEKETVSGKEFVELLGEYREVPSKYSYTPKIS
jgi:cell division protease FtsH